MKIPRQADRAADWVSGHKWATTAIAVAVAVFALACWLPTAASLALGTFAGACLASGFGRDKRLLLASQHDADQILIGRLRGDIARLEAMPIADAATKAIRYIDTDADEGGER